MFEKLQKLVDGLKETNSNNEKKEILAKYPECKDILFYTYHPLYQYNVTSKNCKKLNNIGGDHTEVDNIFQLLDYLRYRQITGYHAIKSVNKFIEKNKEFEDLIYNIIDKDLKCRINASTINKVFKDLIPEFKPALAYKYEDYKNKVDFTKDDWFCSHKLDGIRCIVFKQDENVRFISRTGKEFFTLDNLKEDILNIPVDSFVLDGELCILDENGVENFTSIVSEIRMKDHTIENPKYMVFDFLTVEEFNSKKSKDKLSNRLASAKKTIKETDKIEVLGQTKIKDDDHFESMRDTSVENGWEGLIIRKDVPYEGKRSKNLLKVKLFQEDEFTIKDIEIGTMRHIIYEDGVSREIESEMMTRAIIEYNGYDVGVGSGWTIDQRIDFYNNPEKVIGKEVTVQYFKASKNKQGGESLQFPTVKHFWGEKRDI